MKPIGFAFGREDDWQGDDTNWGLSPEELSSNVKDGKLVKPFSATEMGLIYVNPEGPDGKPDVKKAGEAIRQAFSGMGMTDKETVALIAGGHTFGKTHGAVPAKDVKKILVQLQIKHQSNNKVLAGIIVMALVKVMTLWVAALKVLGLQHLHIGTMIS